MKNFRYEIIELNNQKYFKKIVNVLNEDNILLLENEFNKLEMLKEYNFFPKVIEYNKNENYLLFEYIEGISLKNKTFFSKENTMKFLINLCNILEVLHNKNIIHCDLKPNNIMIDKYGKMYLIDFGVSKMLNEEVNYASILFCSLEQIKEKKACVYFDIYSLGMIMYQLFGGKDFFENKSKKEIILVKENLILSVKDNVIGLPVIIDEVINKCINNKYKNIEELRIDLLKIKESINILV